jgi:hypothetical protein
LFCFRFKRSIAEFDTFSSSEFDTVVAEIVIENIAYIVRKHWRNSSGSGAVFGNVL